MAQPRSRLVNRRRHPASATHRPPRSDTASRQPTPRTPLPENSRPRVRSSPCRHPATRVSGCYRERAAEPARRCPRLAVVVAGRRLGRILLWCGVVGPAFFVVSFLVQGALRPAYDPLRHPVSSLSLGGGAAWVQSATFLVTGLLVIAFAVGLGRAGCGRWTPILIGLVGLGLLGAGVFTSDPINGYPPGTPIPAPRTLPGILHDQFSTPVFTALPAACLVMARRFGRQGARRWRAYSISHRGDVLDLLRPGRSRLQSHRPVRPDRWPLAATVLDHRLRLADRSGLDPAQGPGRSRSELSGQG